VWNVFEANAMAPKGGKVRSESKARAARKNGKQGGRKRTRTLVETIMRRQLSRDQQIELREAFMQLTATEQETFRKFYGLPLRGPKRGKKYVPPPIFYPNTLDGVRPTKTGKRMRHILKKFRLIGRYLLAGS
jgi:hypothetical protein